MSNFEIMAVTAFYYELFKTVNSGVNHGVPFILALGVGVGWGMQGRAHCTRCSAFPGITNRVCRHGRILLVGGQREMHSATVLTSAP